MKQLGRAAAVITKARPERGLVLLVALAALLPDLGAAWPARSYFFRDFSVTFYPLRLFVARELGAGRVPFWNPYIYEGSFALPTFYPLDLLHALWPGPAAVSWLLTLHLPLAAVGAYLLARDLGADSVGGFVAGSVYALGGLSLSSLNLYVFLQSLALAPLLILALRRAARGGGRWIAVAALWLAVSVSTLAAEFVAQGLLLGLALAVVGAPSHRGFLRLGLAVVVGLGLAAVPIAVTLGLLGETVRGAGFARDIALANEVHPATLLQALVPNLFGSLSDPVAAWWGGAFFSKGLPYFLSLYVGALTLALAWTGRSRGPRAEVLVLLLLGGLGLWYSLGAHGGLASALASLPGFRSFRFPSKALFLPHLSLSMLASLGAARLRLGSGWPQLRRMATVAGLIVLGLLGLFWGGGGWLARAARVEASAFPGVRAAVTVSALGTIAVVLVTVLLSTLVAKGRVEPRLASALVAALLVFDLARAGSGMNPQVAPAFFEPLPEMAALRLGAQGGGRVFSYGLDYSPAFRRVLASRSANLSLESFFLNRQLLAPYNNILDRVEASEATDLTSFVPRPRELGPGEYDPVAVGTLVPWLRNAAVSRVISLDPLAHPDLRLLAEVPITAQETAIRVYALDRPAPRAYLACRVVGAADVEDALAEPYRAGFDLARDVVLEGPASPTCGNGQVERLETMPGLERYRTRADGAGLLVVRASFARGWTALLDGVSVPVLRANGKHRAVSVPGGDHEVALRYVPPGLHLGVLCSAAGLLGLGLLLVRPVLAGEGEGRG